MRYRFEDVVVLRKAEMDDEQRRRVWPIILLHELHCLDCLQVREEIHVPIFIDMLGMQEAIQQ
jgi:hypothetical protein